VYTIIFGAECYLTLVVAYTCTNSEV
jgi:hypothetical protein